MSALFSTPEVPKSQPPPTPPQNDIAASEAAAKARLALKARRGHGSTILNAGGPSGMTTPNATPPQKLLGSNSLLGGQPAA